MKFILGTKSNMTQIWQGDKVTAVTCIQTGPCFVTQIKNSKKDGYESVQIGFGSKKVKNISKPQLGHLKKVNSSDPKSNLRFLKEFRSKDEIKVQVGDVIDVSTFDKGDNIQVTSISKGKGFQGVVKRHHFSGGNKSHGNKDQLRMPGSVGAIGPAHVFKGTRMGGRMGGDRVTVKNLEIIEIDEQNNILMVKGAVPGAKNSLVMISGTGDLRVKAVSQEKIAEVESETELKSDLSEEVKIEEAPAENNETEVKK
jgi:large subunit ribosomal protein L3